MRNLTLFLILVGLVTFGYYFEELDEISKRAKAKVKSELFDASMLGEIRGYKTPGTEVVKGIDAYYTVSKHLSVDQIKLDKVFEILSGIKVVTHLKTQEVQTLPRKEYFPNEHDKFTFKFANSEISFLLGKKLDFSQNFYMEVQKGERTYVVVAQDAGPYDIMYEKKNAHNSGQRYRRVKTILYLDDQFFHDRHIFKDRIRKLKKQKWSKVGITNSRNRAFEIDLIKSSTSPAIIEGLDHYSQFFSTFVNELVAIEGEKIISPFSTKDLDEYVGKVEIFSKQWIKQELLLYKTYKGEKGYFVITNFDKSLYKLDQKTAQVFFYNVQDFWERKVFSSQSNFRNSCELFEMVFQDGRSFELSLPQKAGFNVVNTKNEFPKPNNSSFKALLKILSQTMADRVSKVNRDDNFEDDPSFNLKFRDFNVQVVLKDKELVLVNKKHKYKLHYSVGEKPPIGMKFEDFFI